MKEEVSKMTHATSSLEKLVKLLDTAGAFLAPPPALALGKEFWRANQWLNSWSLERDRNSFAIVAKHETFIHLVMNCKFGAPQDIGVLEVRSMLDTSPRCATAFLLVSAPPSCWLCHKYGLLVHFLLTRSMQLDSTWILGKIEKITQGWLWKRPWAPGSWKDHGRVPGS